MIIFGLSMFNNFLDNCICKDISFCDNLVGQYSYVSESLGNMSLTNHVFMSNNVKNHPISHKLIDSGANLSDHKPLTFVLSVINLKEPSEEVARADPDRLNPVALFSIRWDKCDKFV